MWKKKIGSASKRRGGRGTSQEAVAAIIIISREALSTKYLGRGGL